jgi:RNA polymerase sigma factor (sigma-70 family)
VTGASDQSADPALPTTHQQDPDTEITAFFAEYHKKIHRFLVANGCEEHEAHDIVQDTILAVRQQWERVRTLEKPVAYWYKAAIRRLRRVQGERARRYAAGDPDEHLLTMADPVNAPANVNLRVAMVAMLRDLPTGQRQVLWLRAVAGFSESQTAEIMSIRPGTVKSQLHDARARMEELRRKYCDVWEADL